MHRFTGEPDLSEVLADPIVQALMRADGCVMRSFYDSLAALHESDSSAAPCCGAPLYREPQRRR